MFGKRKIDELKRDLYSKNKKNFNSFGFNLKKKNKKKKELKTDIKNENLESYSLLKYNNRGPTVFFTVFVLSIVFFIISIIFTATYFVLNKNVVDADLDISIIGPDSVRSGDVFDFIVRMENNTDMDYRNLELVVDFPPTAIDANDKKPLKQGTVLFDNLLSGGVLSQRYSLSLSGLEGDKKDIKITVFFKTSEFSNTVSAQRVYSLEISTSPVHLEINNPKLIVPNKEFEFDIRVSSNSSVNVNDLVLLMNVPIGYEFLESNMKAAKLGSREHMFYLGNLEPGNYLDMKVKGKILGQNNEIKFFKFKIGEKEPLKKEIRSLFSVSERELKIRDSDLRIEFFAKNKDEGDILVTEPGKEVPIKLVLKNNSVSSISDINLEAKIDGDYFYKNKLYVGYGHYDSANDLIIWSKNTDKRLYSLGKDEEWNDEVVFKIKPISRIEDYKKDPEIKINIKATGIGFVAGTADNEISDELNKKIRLGTKLDFYSSLLFDEGPFDNYGNIDPIVGEPTSYTVVWRIKNTSSDVEDLEVKAFLPIYVKFLGAVEPKSAYLSYNINTREVTWKYKKIKAYSGYTEPPKEVYFQIELNPSAIHKGKYPVLLKDIELKAFDSFIKKEINEKYDNLTTKIRLNNDEKWNAGIVK